MLTESAILPSLAPTEIPAVVEEELGSTPIVDVLFRSSDITPEQYWKFSKTEQADAIWRALFVEHTPVSESTRGVVAVLQAFGLGTAAPDLREARAFFAAQEPVAHIREYSNWRASAKS